MGARSLKPTVCRHWYLLTCVWKFRMNPLNDGGKTNGS